MLSISDKFGVSFWHVFTKPFYNWAIYVKIYGQQLPDYSIDIHKPIMINQICKSICISQGHHK